MSAPIPIYLAVEDELSEWVCRRVLAERPVEYHVGPVFRKNGFGYLRTKAEAFNKLSRAVRFLLLTDLDSAACPVGLRSEWLTSPVEPNFLFRVAVREVESWLLGDLEGLAAYLGVSSAAGCETPETIPDPKQVILSMARRARKRDLREGLMSIDRRTGNVRQGPDYNGILGIFVRERWNVLKSADRCPSLQRMMAALERRELGG